jgi:NAD+--dinitrogen-reductase ADP-D-ribosyltransferase
MLEDGSAMSNPLPRRNGLVSGARQAAPIFNRCNLSPWAIATQSFQDDPQPLQINAVEQEDGHFFRMLDRIDDQDERGMVFHEYATSRFWLYETKDSRPDGRHRWNYSYLHVLTGWGADSNSYAGAVLKGWAEHRFGLPTTYHQGCQGRNAEARDRYESARMRGATLGIGVQLDLLYTFCQHELARRRPGERWTTLYRGTHDPDEYVVKHDPGERRNLLVEFNSVSSFTSDNEVAWEFGSSVWRVQVPLAKVVFFSGLLPQSLLKGESEFIVLGGDYLVKPLLC